MVHKSTISTTGGGGGSVNSVTGLNTDNSDASNPVVKISVDGVTVTGAGTPGSPLVSVGGGGGAVSSVSNSDGTLSIFPTAGAVVVSIASLSSANILIGNISGVAKSRPIAGDVTLSNNGTTTLATVNSNIGSFGSSTAIPILTVNGKGLTTAASTAPVVAPAGTLTGTTIGSGVVTSFLTTIGTIGTGVWQGTKVGLAYGGTNADLSGTGGASQVLQQSSGGAAVTVGQLAASDLSNGTTGSGAVVLATAPTMSNPVVGTQAAADNSTKGASTAYVTSAINTAIAGVNPAVAVLVATTQASDTSSLTYFNGVSGIGATFTGSNNTALTIDGVTLTSVNQRVLVKNDTQSPSGAFNGVYYLTQIQTAILPPILTRALDYDMPSDINNTGAIPVVSGTVNGTTSWVLTSTITTVGTDALTFTKFSINPTTILTNTLTNTHLFVGNSSNVATDVAMSGDTSLANTGAVTVAKINGNTLSTTTPTSTNILIGNGLAWATQSVSGDGTISNTGSLTVTKTSGTAFGTLATLNAAPAGTLTGTTLGSTVVTSSLTTVGTLANLTVTNPISGSVTGSAATLTTPRAINGVNFDGSAAITVPAAAGTLTGTTIGTAVVTSTLTSVGILTGGATGVGFTVNLGSSTIAGTLGTINIANSAVTYAKIQNESATTVLGNPTGSVAAPSEITLSTNLGFTGTKIFSFDPVTANACGGL